MDDAGTAEPSDEHRAEQAGHRKLHAVRDRRCHVWVELEGTLHRFLASSPTVPGCRSWIPGTCFGFASTRLVKASLLASAAFVTASGSGFFNENRSCPARAGPPPPPVRAGRPPRAAAKGGPAAPRATHLAAAGPAVQAHRREPGVPTADKQKPACSPDRRQRRRLSVPGAHLRRLRNRQHRSREMGTSCEGRHPVQTQQVAHGKYALHVQGLGSGSDDWATLFAKNVPAALKAPQPSAGRACISPLGHPPVFTFNFRSPEAMAPVRGPAQRPWRSCATWRSAAMTASGSCRSTSTT